VDANAAQNVRILADPGVGLQVHRPQSEPGHTGDASQSRRGEHTTGRLEQQDDRCPLRESPHDSCDQVRVLGFGQQDAGEPRDGDCGQVGGQLLTP
jgi:hypothetical protein